MFCKYCRKEIDDDSIFCSSCGKKVVGNANDTPSTNTENNAASSDKKEESVFNLDNYKGTKHVSKDLGDKVGYIWCYKLPQKDIDVLWNNLPDVFMVDEEKWHICEPEYGFVDDYDDELMYNYNFLCTSINKNKDGEKYIEAYIINHEDEVMNFVLRN